MKKVLLQQQMLNFERHSKYKTSSSFSSILVLFISHELNSIERNNALLPVPRVSQIAG
jgi:hypothetical protein